MEVSNDLVHAQAALDAAALMSLLFQLLGVVFALALLDTLALAECPRSFSVRIPDLIASLAAAGLLGVVRGVGAVARSAVRWVEMGSGFVGGVT